ncbi:hypothetical protein Ddc_10094 [Ditylenchus destructor]|nr:hypothetical protein Ddc_10094 [Ditylenchus destructor]
MSDIPAIESKETRGSSRLGKEQMNSENEAETEPKAMKSQSDERISNIAAMDNGTMVETFKFLNYCQLAKNSLTSKRFRDVISTHRHLLALLDVDEIFMYPSGHFFDRAVIKMFSSKELSSEEYDEFIARNGYLKQIPIESQIAGKESTKDGHNFFDFIADAFKSIRSLSKYFPNFSTITDGNIHEFSADVNGNRNMFARAKLNDENWPVFRHFFHLLMDPFIYIRSLSLWPEKDVFSVLTGAMDPDRGRLQCKFLGINFNADTQKFIAWIKNHVRCDEFRFSVASNYDEVLLDLFMTGAPFTSSIRLPYNDLSRISVDLVQKFMDLKNRDEYQVVELIRGNVRDWELHWGITKRLFDSNLNELKLKYAQCITEKEQSGRTITGFINNDIAKKLSLTVCNRASSSNGFSLSIEIS